MARRATIIDQERDTGGAVLVLDAGDSLTGDQDPARRTKGGTSVAIMNMMGYDAMALGPADLALGLNALRERLAEAKFKVLSSNAIVSPSGELIAAPYVFRDSDGHRIAIVGLSGGTETQEIALRDPLESALEAVTEVRPKADIVILLSHAGALIDQEIAETIPGIDLIVSGGPFQIPMPWQSEKTGTLVVHADEAFPGHAGRRIGIARLTFDDKGHLLEHSWKRLDLVPDISSDPTVADWAQQQATP